MPMGEPAFDTSEFLIKREVPDEPPPPSEDFVDLDQHNNDYSFPPVVKVNHNYSNNNLCKKTDSLFPETIIELSLETGHQFVFR